MKDLNSCTFIGRLTKDADLRVTNTGIDVANFSIAVNSSEKAGDQWRDKANFFDMVLFGRAATGVGPYLKKGTQVGVQAEAQFETWEKDGQRHSKVKFSVRNIQILNRPSGSHDREPEQFNSDIPF